MLLTKKTSVIVMSEKIEHIKCVLCEKDITYEEEVDGEVEINHHTHFDIVRSYKSYEVIDGCPNVDEENEKMRIEVCKECFDKILNESKTLGDYFTEGNPPRFVY